MFNSIVLFCVLNLISWRVIVLFSFVICKRYLFCIVYAMLDFEIFPFIWINFVILVG